MPVDIAVADLPRLAPPHVEVHATPAALASITRAEINLAIWRRTLPADLAASVAAHRDRPIAGEMWFDACAAASTIEAGFASLLADVTAADRTLWRVDIETLVAQFAELSGAHVVRATLETVTGPGCRKFHVDHVGLRLLCTYDGAGTQWVADSAVERPMLAIGDNEDVVADPAAIEALATGDVGLFKGEAWPGNAGRGIVHRSPPVRGARHRRVLLCLDAGMVDHSRLGRPSHA
jgi:hypothetical protein